MNLPTIYKFKGDSEKYMIGSEVGSRLNLYKGALYKRFPKLWRRVITKEEKKELAEMGVNNRVLANWEVMFIKASDGEAILKGEGTELKGPRPKYGAQQQQAHQKPAVLRASQSLSTIQSIYPTKLIKGGDAEIHLGALIKPSRPVVSEVYRRAKRRGRLRRLILPWR
eukprot:gene14296-15783_t